MSALIKIWESIDGCAEKYICDTSLYIMSVSSERHSIIFNRVISAPGYGKEVVDVLIPFTSAICIN